MIPDVLIDKDLLNWIEEDLPMWDVSAQIMPIKETTAKIISKQEGTICGVTVIQHIFKKFGVKMESMLTDGDTISQGDTVCTIQGLSKNILQAERIVLNIFSHMSGIATTTRRYQDVLEENGSKAKIAGTRKTLPGLRKYEKWAIQCGGGDTHRTSLSDMVMFKENHIAAFGSISQALTKIRSIISFSTKVEIEVRDLNEAEEAARSQADIIMLDNFNLTDIKPACKAIRDINPDIIIEVSGNVTYDSLQELSKFDLDIISSGKLTHSVNAFDLSLLFDNVI